VEDILEQARKLGAAIAHSPQAAALADARKRLDEKPEVKKLMDDLRRQSEKLAELERQKKPIEVEDKHKEESLRDTLLADDAFKKYTAAQVEYVDLMRKVSAAMTASMSPPGDRKTVGP
jgi:cell fate (sporulation/competence/biofilm development) regulator YlbF (YheA/YmcA/DUF963 family)